jgi:hypothetical protein
MAVKTLTRRKKIKPISGLAYGRQLRELIEDQRALAKRLVKLIEQLEDEEDHRAIEKAERENAGKPGIPWEEAKKRLGLKF